MGATTFGEMAFGGFICNNESWEAGSECHDGKGMDIAYAIPVGALLRDKAKEPLGWRPNLDIGVGLDIISKVVFRIIFGVILEHQLHNSSKLLLVSSVQVC